MTANKEVFRVAVAIFKLNEGVESLSVVLNEQYHSIFSLAQQFSDFSEVTSLLILILSIQDMASRIVTIIPAFIIF